MRQGRASDALTHGSTAASAEGSHTVAVRRFAGPVRRVAIVGPDWMSLSRLRGDLVAHILGLGHQVMCLAPDGTQDPVGEHARRLAQLGAQCAAFPMRMDGVRPLLDRKTIKALRAKFADWQPHVVVGSQLKPMLLANIAAERAGVPHIVALASDLGPDLGGEGRPGWPWRRLSRAGFGAATSVVCHNRADLDRLQELQLVPDDASVGVVAGAGVDLQRYRATPLPNPDFGVTFVMLATLRREKGVLDFCAAAKKVRGQFSDARFVLAGPEGTCADAVTRDELKRYADCVEVMGDHADVRPLFAEAHAIVLPSWREGMSRTLMEALASGRAVIATDIPGCREMVDERVNGILVPPRDPKALAAAMVNVITLQEQLPSMARASRLKAERLFDMREINRALADVLGLV